ncbi:MAG: 4Fe-4S dicluster domain-containing protein [Desulfomonile sp.]|nr:4Fe-4S dicluster domain-containing protein [Desulfomonile sp.]
MPHDKAYDDLLSHMRTSRFNLPDSEVLLPMLRMRFSPEEARFLARFPFRPSTLDELTRRLGLQAERLLDVMEPIIHKGLICEFDGKRGTRYVLSDVIFSYYRMPGWRGLDDEWNRKLASLSNRYYVDHLGADFRGYPTKGLRAIPIAQTIADLRRIMPYEDVVQIVDQHDYFCVTTCACRHRHNIDPDVTSCKHETVNCLHFGMLAHYIVKHEMGRQISREEMFDILTQAADAGLVHGISNAKTGADTICNCCACCCVFLETINTPYPVPMGHQRSNYLLNINRGKCKACGLCVQRCPMKALELREKTSPSAEIGSPTPRKKAGKKLKEIVYEPDRCIGCGVCVHKCPTGSLGLVRRGEEEDIPETMSETGRRMLLERGRDPEKAF